MTKLCTPFQFFLFLSLFLFYCPPSLQMSPSLPIYRNNNRFREQLVHYRDVIKGRMGHYGHSMKPPGQGRRLGLVNRYISYGALARSRTAPANEVYFVRFGFGTPPTQVDTVLDTGSAVTWIQCHPCHGCNKESGPIFDPAKSKSYKPLGCNSQQCQRLEEPPECPDTSQACLYKFSYPDKYVTRGDFATENITLSPHTTLPNIPFGCSHENKGDSGTASGVFGLGRGSVSFISQSQYSAFSYCLTQDSSSNSNGSLLQFGTSATFSDAVLTIPMFRNTKLPSLYFVGLTGISVNDQIITVPPINSSTGFGGAIVDCGTIVTRFPKDVYERLHDAFVKAATGYPVLDTSGPFDTCFGHTSRTERADFPVVAFHFSEARLTLPPENVMISYGSLSNRVYRNTCFGFEAADVLYTLIGSHQQQGIRVSFDEDSSKVGFLPGNC